MSVLTLEAKLERQDPGTTWGFRMQGGKDFSSPLTIARVTPGSLAAKCGLQQGDVILKIGNKSSDILKHKDAQDTIISYGNKLDLLLQRIREKRIQNGFGIDYSHHRQGGAPTYDKFSTPNISSYQTPAGGPGAGQTNVNFNPAPKPFGAAPSKPPAPYQPPVDNLAQKTTQININAPAPNYSKYADIDDKPGPTSHQSRSFKFLQGTLDSGQDPPAALRPTVDLRRSPSPNAGVIKQFNSPIGLYSSANVPKQPPTQVPQGGEIDIGTNDLPPPPPPEEMPTMPTATYDDQGKRLYRPSETFKLIHEQENEPEKQEKPADVKQTRTILALEKQLGGENEQKLEVKLIHTVMPPDGEVKAYYPSETFQLVHERSIQPFKAEIAIPDHSRSFKELERQLGQQDSAPAPAPARAPPAPKPGVWTPGQGSSGGAPAPKPFSPSVAPPKPGGAAPKPSGVGAVRGKIGDAVIKSGGEPGGPARVPICASCGAPIRGPFVSAMGNSWCPDHFICANPRCGVKLMDIGFVEEGGFLYCEKDYELYFAPRCSKCEAAIIGECVNALTKQYHPACFLCHQCKQPIGGNQFHLEEGNAYCENDWRQMFQTMCGSCNFPIEPGDKWVEALSSNFHSECFNCSTCQVNLEGQAFYAKSGKPYCKKHAR